VKVKEYGSGGIPASPEPAAAGERIIPAGECGEGEMGSAKESVIPVIAEVPAFRYARVCKEGPVFEAKEILWE
jgi:hypothetical protein